MNDEPTPPPRRPFSPLMDRLGELCRDGKESAEYLWQVPHDDEVRRKIVGFLAEMGGALGRAGGSVEGGGAWVAGGKGGRGWRQHRSLVQRP